MLDLRPGAHVDLEQIVGYCPGTSVTTEWKGPVFTTPAGNVNTMHIRRYSDRDLAMAFPYLQDLGSITIAYDQSQTLVRRIHVKDGVLKNELLGSYHNQFELAADQTQRLTREAYVAGLVMEVLNSATPSSV